MKFNLDEIITATSGYIFYKGENFSQKKEYFVSGIPHLIEDFENTVFLPKIITINGVLEDSFVMIEKMIKAGVRSIFFDEIRFKDEKYNNILMNILTHYRENIDFIVMVNDTQNALRGLAAFVRYRKLPQKVKYAAVTGSIGKTSTTEMLYAVLSEKYKTFRGEPTFNIRYRIMHKFLETPEDIDWLLFECSGQNRGYLKDYSEIIMPDAAIVTKIANENLGEYRTVANLAKEKASILSAMGENSVAVLNGIDVLRNASRDYICKRIFSDDDKYELLCSDKSGSEFVYENEKYFIPVVGLHQINNAIKVIELTKALGFSSDEIRNGLKNFTSVGDRWVVDKFNNCAEFITDCPNNPSYDTLISGINTFMNLYKDNVYKRLIITRIKALGDLEDSTYKKIAQYISKLDIQELICVGSEITLIRDYVSANSSIKVLWFEKPQQINEDDKFIKYLLDTLNFEQATFLKGQRKDGNIGYGKVKEILRKYLN
ncbi:MAG: Mur ligase family protein [Candidatus Gastranaerophilaceae bacterium]